MSLFYQILDEHKNLLLSKGYDETSLNSPDKEGRFIRQLQINLSQAIKDAHNFQETESFDLKATGFFNDDADIVRFKLHYEYNPNDMQLCVKSLEAILDDKTINLELNDNNDLPAATKVHKYLTEGDKLEKARQIVNQHASLSRSNQQNKRI